jgi:hypothetical protein
VTGEGLHWEGDALAARSRAQRVTGIEPALSAREFAESVQFMQPEQKIRHTSTTRERPLIPVSSATGLSMGTEKQKAGTSVPPPRPTDKLGLLAGHCRDSAVVGVREFSRRRSTSEEVEGV